MNLIFTLEKLNRVEDVVKMIKLFNKLFGDPNVHRLK